MHFCCYNSKNWKFLFTYHFAIFYKATDQFLKFLNYKKT